MFLLFRPERNHRLMNHASSLSSQQLDLLVVICVATVVAVVVLMLIHSILSRDHRSEARNPHPETKSQTAVLKSCNLLKLSDSTL